MPHSLFLPQIIELQNKPEMFSPGAPLFWDDPYISEQLLKVHLDPTVDQASRKPETITASVAWIIEMAGLQPGDQVLDLGCGPGLYAVQFARCGLGVTGVDYSRRSIDYARASAVEQGLAITYRRQNYLDLEDEAQYDAAVLIFGDYCTFNPNNRRKVLQNVWRALKPGGWFILDVSTREHRQRYGAKNSWYASEGGFWRPGPHLVLEQGFNYPQELVYLDQYIVVDVRGEIVVYRNWFQDYQPEMIQDELRAGGFEVDSLWGDLTGKALAPGCEWIGVVARKPN